MKKHVLIIGGGLLQVPLLQAAGTMGLRCTVFDKNPDCPGAALAESFFSVSISDEQACLEMAIEIHRIHPIHGVITAGTDRSTTVAMIARHLGLPGIKPEDALAASEKFRMRERLKEAGVPVPDFALVENSEGCILAAQKIGFPLVLKPVRNMGARGVSLVRDDSRLLAAYESAIKEDPRGLAVLEAYMDGPELSVDALAWNGNIRITGIADRIITGEPYFIETGHTMPGSQSESVIAEATKVMIQGMKALGIHTGAGKGDLKITSKGVMVGEIAARLSGGFMSSHTYPLHSGVALHRAAIQIALGLEPEGLEPVRNLVAIERCICGSEGKITELDGKNQMLLVPGVEAVFFTKKPGDFLQKATSNLDKVGHILATGETLEDAEKSVQKAMKMLRLQIRKPYGDERARSLLGKVCRVCSVCDGERCASSIPGMGGAGTGESFRRNHRDLNRITITPSFLRDPSAGDTKFDFFGRPFQSPIMIAPMTGVHTNMNGFTSEEEFIRMLAWAAQETGHVYWTGDSASPEGFATTAKTVKEMEIPAVAILKPRGEKQKILDRIRLAEDSGFLAVGVDVDSLELATMTRRGEPTFARNASEWRKIRETTSLPFIFKGILNTPDALNAMAAGVDAIVVSNHGGRTSDSYPSAASVLTEIIRTVNNRMQVFADGGVRGGESAFKYLQMGAAGVLVGRPLIIAAAGEGKEGVAGLLTRYSQELSRIMKMSGVDSLKDFKTK